MRNPNLIDKLHAQLPAPARRLLDNLLRLAGQQDVPLFLVGGPLRDLLLDRPAFDLDIAIEGDAIALARDLADATGGCAVTHPRFGTATVGLGEFHLDLITARSETYGRPGVLPTVEPATIREDLLRRDFTINAVALRLNGPQRGEILDPAGGLADLDARLVRALHERSFQDDATRILRAFRYARRLDFEIEGRTLEWLRRDIAYLRKISPARIHGEMLRVLAEPDPAAVLLELNSIGALRMIHRDLRFGLVQAQAMREVRRRYEYFSLAGWVLLTWPESSEGAARLSWRLRLSALQREAIARVPRLLELRPSLSRPGLKASEMHDILRGFGGPELWPFAAIEGGIVRERILSYLRTRSTKTELDGNDLIALGVPPSKLIGEILHRLRAAKLDGEVKTRHDEERLVRRLMERAPAEKTPLPAHPESLP